MEIRSVSKKEGTHLAVENNSREMIETAEMPMTAARRRKVAWGSFVVQHFNGPWGTGLPI